MNTVYNGLHHADRGRDGGRGKWLLGNSHIMKNKTKHLDNKCNKNLIRYLLVIQKSTSLGESQNLKKEHFLVPIVLSPL